MHMHRYDVAAVTLQQVHNGLAFALLGVGVLVGVIALWRRGRSQ